MNNEIILGDNVPGSVGNIYIGPLATKAAYNAAMQKTLDSLIDAIKAGTTANRGWAYSYLDGVFTLRAGQSTKESAIHYMTDETYVLVWKE